MRFGTSSRERILAFLFEKKGYGIRLIFGCRTTNQWLKVPRKVRFFSGAFFALIDVSPSTCIYAGGLDVKDAFCRMELPEELSPFFSLDYVTAGEMGWFTFDGEAVDPDFRIFRNCESSQQDGHGRCSCASMPSRGPAL